MRVISLHPCSGALDHLTQARRLPTVASILNFLAKSLVIIREGQGSLSSVVQIVGKFSNFLSLRSIFIFVTDDLSNYILYISITLLVINF